MDCHPRSLWVSRISRRCLLSTSVAVSFFGAALGDRYLLLARPTATLPADYSVSSDLCERFLC